MDRAGNILRALLDRRLVAQGEQYGALFRCWGAVAGEQIAAHSEIADIRNGVVVVVADHPGWIQLIQLKQHYMLEELRRRFPELGIRALRFQLPRADEAAGLAQPRDGVAAEGGHGGEAARPAGEGGAATPSAEAAPPGARSGLPDDIFRESESEAESEAGPAEADPALAQIRDGELRELLKRLADGIERRAGDAPRGS